MLLCIADHCQLARAGFYYEPSHESEDNAQCYLCHCNIDMWEGEDDPIEEHVKHSAGCGWANIVSIEHMIENGQRDFGNPMGGEAVNARSMTFDSRWPHEDKRGWTCKISKVRKSSEAFDLRSGLRLNRWWKPAGISVLHRRVMILSSAPTAISAWTDGSRRTIHCKAIFLAR